jgi:hypothetical protein
MLTEEIGLLTNYGCAVPYRNRWIQLGDVVPDPSVVGLADAAVPAVQPDRNAAEPASDTATFSACCCMPSTAVILGRANLDFRGTDGLIATADEPARVVDNATSEGGHRWFGLAECGRVRRHLPNSDGARSLKRTKGRDRESRQDYD